ncbi:tetratricopeptide repeat protein [Candidatus Riflebacteria bacterium]
MRMKKSGILIGVTILTLFFSGCGISTVWEYFGDKRTKEAKLQRALAWYKDGTRYGTKDVNLYKKWARTGIKLQRWSETTNALAKGFKNLPEHTDLLGVQIEFFYAQAKAAKSSAKAEGLAKEARDWIKKLEKKDSDHVPGLFFSGKIFTCLSDLALAVGKRRRAGTYAKQAIKYLKKYVRNFKPDQEFPGSKEEGHIELALLFKRAGDSKSAESNAKIALKAKDKKIKARANALMGDIYLLQKKPEEAKKYFEAAVSIDRKQIEANLGLAYMLGINSGTQKEALEKYKNILNWEPGRLSSYIEAGKLLRRMKKFKDLNHLMKKALKINQHDQRVLLLYAESLKALGNTDTAQTTLRAVIRLNSESAAGKRAQKFLDQF